MNVPLIEQAISTQEITWLKSSVKQAFCVHTVITDLASFRQVVSMQYEACKSGGQGLGMYTCSSLDIAWSRTDARTKQRDNRRVGSTWPDLLEH
jgi:hypothetical protein